MNYLRGIIIAAIIAATFAYIVSGRSQLVSGIPLIFLLTSYIFIVQLIAFVPAKIFNTEKFYDLVGSLTYITTVSIAAVYNRHLTTRQIIVSLFVYLWAFRLGSFLFIRILIVGEDSRFQKIKKSTLNFFFAWFIQGLWVFLTALPVYVILSQVDPPVESSLNLLEWVGILIWSVGFVVETVADFQKFMFKMGKGNKQKFIRSGAWAYSRHPNYFGEITLWFGVSVFALSSLKGGELLALVSPVFVYFLLTKVSGVPLLEHKADKKWGGDPQYQQYKAKTPVLFPWKKTQLKSA